MGNGFPPEIFGWKGQTGVRDSWILVLDKGINGRTHNELPEVGKNMV